MDLGPRIPSIRNHSLLTEHNSVEFVEARAGTNIEYKNAILKNDVLREKDIVNDLEENRVKRFNEDFANPDAEAGLCTIADACEESTS
jgi:hypothetical protein